MISVNQMLKKFHKKDKKKGTQYKQKRCKNLFIKK